VREQDTRRKGEGCLGGKGEGRILKTFGMEGYASCGMVYGEKNKNSAIPEDYE